MGLRRIRIDYTVYPSDWSRENGTHYNFRTFKKAKAGARRLGTGASIYRNFNAESKRSRIIGEWWQANSFWLWDGARLLRFLDERPISTTYIRGERETLWQKTYSI